MIKQQLIFAILGVAFNEIYFASPCIFIYRHYKEKLELKYLPTIQVLINLLNYSQWIISGIHGNKEEIDYQKIICNSIGAIISAILIVFLWSFYSRKNHKEYLIYLFMIFNVAFQIFYICFYFTRDKQLPELTMTLSIIFNIAMYSSPLIQVYFAWKTKTKELIPIFNVCFGFLASLSWIIYSSFSLIENRDSFIANIGSITVLFPSILSYLILMKKFPNTDKNEIHNQLVVEQE